MIIPDEILGKLCALERELHATATRANRSRLDKLLHRDFWEIGRSGVIFTRSQVLESLPADDRARVIQPFPL